MVHWQQALIPSAIFYVLAIIVSFCVALMIHGMATALHRIEAHSSKKSAK